MASANRGQRYRVRWLGRRDKAIAVAVLGLLLLPACASGATDPETASPDTASPETVSQQPPSPSSSGEEQAAPEDLGLVEEGILTAVARSSGENSYVEGDEVTGFTVELVREIGERLGLDVEFRIVDDTAAGIQAVQTGQYDIYAGLPVVPQPSRLENFEFSQPISYGRWAWLTTDASGFTSPDDLVDGLVGTQQESAQFEYLRDQGFDEADITLYSSQDAAVLALVADQVDGVLVGNNVVEEVLPRYPQLVVMGRVTNPYRGALAMSDGKTALAAAVDEALDAIYLDCTFIDLYEEFLPGQTVGVQYLDDQPEAVDCLDGSPASPPPSEPEPGASPS